jgi:hypothetical protein
MSRSGVVAVLSLALLASGCGSGGGGVSNPGQALSATAANLGKIRSGTLHLDVGIEPHGDDGGAFGFELEGPFELAKPGKLPVAKIDYTQTAGDERETVTFTSTGDRAYVTVDGTPYELPADRVEELRGSSDGESGAGLEELRIDDWIESAESSDGGDVGGTSTDKISADLDVVAAVNDLIAVAQGFGGPSLSPIEGEAATQLREAVQEAKLEVWTGTEDRLLRRLRIEADFDPQLPDDLEELARAANSTVTFELGIDDPNEAVEVEAPEGARPYSELGT